MQRLSEDFWTRVQNAPERVLMIDYDGTLAPFRTARMEAKPAEETLAILRKIIDSGHTKVVVVSGRPTSELSLLLPDLGVETFGSHGFERAASNRTVIVHPLSPSESTGLEEARKAAVAAGLKERLEVKPASMAVHTRGLGSEEALETEELAYNVFTPVAERYGLECRAFNGGVEIRSKRFHKGLAVDALLKESPPNVLAVYVGDDETDEDAFRALAGRGIGVRVGAPASDTAAQIQLERQADITGFLQQWHDHASRSGAVEVEHRPSRLVVVSNRLPSIEIDAEGFRHRPVGGLANAIESALSQSKGGGLWMGWSGSITRRREDQLSETDVGESVKLIGIDLTRREHAAYYNGFSNNTVWPLFHSFPKLTQSSSWQLEVYRTVNEMFAKALTSVLEKSDLVWVHDYHLMLLGEELRRFGWTKPIGFFLHTPFPALDIFAILPHYLEFLKAFQAYDLMGFQTSIYRDNYVYACRRGLGAQWDGERLIYENHRQRVGVYPVGIEVEKFLPAEVPPRRGALGESLRSQMGDRDLIIGVDRLDYTKGMPERVLAFEELFKLQPNLKGKVSLVQISSPSRTEVEQYKEQRQMMDALVGRINGELGEHDWLPIQYLYRSYNQEELVEFYREARVGLVTPLRDGMNLVAKEYVAAQNPEDPGVLVLSRFAGAVEELTDAVIVNPYLPDDTAKGIAEAFAMPLDERRARHASLLERIKKQTARKWSEDFVSDLERTSA